ncbi:MAG: MerR family transcriptional regulator [Oscillospiraceae bacterium]|nr:MerR family transcriptional regulator [Oscillospiraceae bacterium]
MDKEYNIGQLSDIAGISSRTLRYYDEIGLLRPSGKNRSGYRFYTQSEVDILHQIMFYRQSGMALNDIKAIICSQDFDPLNAMEQHKEKLLQQRKELDNLIKNAEKTIKMLKGETMMNNKEKFEAFKAGLVEENERKYGKEIREKYGDEAVNARNQKLLDMSREEYRNLEEVNEALNEALRAAVENGDPSSAIAQKACELHRRWLGFYWNFYSKEAHLNLCMMYTQDERFKEYYEKIAEGGAEFLYKAMQIYLA